MKPLFDYFSDNSPFLFVCGVVLGIASSLLFSTAAYLRI
jgi:hypothetical protein